ncbi:hypothetical protein GQ44DRAFT_717998 [Phaeosphaeriaceae sp. PMI808]|nr:hypothetical protein GQ44DRAFT_717998 [Phaeosphaeriaceae sp. PMI808]
MGTLNKVQPKPKLGSESRTPSPQQVAQWILNVETAFRSVQALEDNETRLYWVLNTIQYDVHRELIQQKINDGTIRTWDGLKAEQRRLVQDPVLTKFQNYHRFWNFEWRSTDTLNSFLLHLSKKESLLPESFPKLDDNEELKISYVWAKAPDTYQKELQRNGSLNSINNWEEFERAIRNAETAISTAGTRAPRALPEGSSPRHKRQATSHGNGTPFGKKQDRKQPFKRRPSPGRDSTPTEAPQSPAHAPGARPNNNTRNYEPDSQQGYQKPHWKNRNNNYPSREDNEGKEKP